MAETKTTDVTAVVDDPLKTVKETSEKAKYAAAEDADPGRGDATNGKAWATEYRVDNKKGVIVGFDGKKFEYDVEGLGEYSIEQNRAKAIEKAEKHFEDSRHLAQHHFETGDKTGLDGNPA